MLAFPNAKINLGLHILEKLDNGFHRIESVFYPIPFADVLEILPLKNLEKKTLPFQTSGISIPGDPKNNLCLKAYHLLKKDFDLPEIALHLHKIIPIGAGLGGGSSDGAFALKILNDLFKLKLSNSKLKKNAALLGSDCPFFIENQAAYLNGIGAELEPFNLDLSHFYLVLVYPNIHINTSLAYQNSKPKAANYDLKNLLNQPIQNWKNQLTNDFENFAFTEFPILKNIKEKLYQLGASYAAMSGSGSTIFGIFEEKIDLSEYFSDFVFWQGSLKI